MNQPDPNFAPPYSQPTTGQIDAAARIQVNLDTLEREVKREPFSFVLNGRQIVLSDPADLDWQIVESFTSEREFLRHAMSEADLEHFLTNPMPIWKMEHLGKQYQAHYGIEEPGKAD